MIEKLKSSTYTTTENTWSKNTENVCGKSKDIVDKLLCIIWENIQLKKNIKAFNDLKSFLHNLFQSDLSYHSKEKQNELVKLFRILAIEVDLWPELSHNVSHPIIHIDNYFQSIDLNNPYSKLSTCYNQVNTKLFIKKAIESLEHAFLIFLITQSEYWEEYKKMSVEENYLKKIISEVILTQKIELSINKEISCRTLNNSIKKEIIFLQNKAFFINLLYNIIKNASINGKATEIDFSFQNWYLLIKDNWIWINTTKFPNPNVILQNWVTEFWSWIWLSYLEEFWVECEVSNQWLQSKTSPGWKWASFKIKLASSSSETTKTKTQSSTNSLKAKV